MANVWTAETEEIRLEVQAEKAAERKYVLTVPEIPEALKDVRMRIDYRGDIGMMFLGNEMISDNFCNGDTWEIGLKEHRERIGKEKPVLTIAPVREGAAVNVESAMAARNETAEREIGELDRVELQAVYEIGI